MIIPDITKTSSNNCLQFEWNYPISELNHKHLNNIRYFLYAMILFSYFFVNLMFLHRELQVLFQILDITKNVKHDELPQ